MTRNIIFTLACCTTLLINATTAIADTKVTALNMDLGDWVTTAGSSAMIEKILASMPEENRAMIRKMMEKKMQDASTTDQCVTAETLDDFGEQLKSSLGNAENCDCLRMAIKRLPCRNLVSRTTYFKSSSWLYNIATPTKVYKTWGALPHAKIVCCKYCSILS